MKLRTRCLTTHSDYGQFRTRCLFVHSRTVRPKSPPSQSMWKMGHPRKGSWALPKRGNSLRCVCGGAQRAWRLTQASHPRSFQVRSRQRFRRVDCQTGADAAYFDREHFALLRARCKQEPSKLKQQPQAASVRTLNRSVPHDLVAHSCFGNLFRHAPLSLRFAANCVRQAGLSYLGSHRTSPLLIGSPRCV